MPTVPQWREELKFWIEADQAQRIARAIGPFTIPDPHSDPRGGAAYTVRSIYYDSPKFDFYYHKIDGLRRRKKLRVRSYARDGTPQQLFLEIKHKRGRKVLKERAPLPPALCLDTLTAKALPLHPDKQVSPTALRSAGRFVGLTRQLGLDPVILVVYDRTAYVDRANPSVRLTMDRTMRSLLRPTYDHLFEESELHPCTNGHVILELKFPDFMPRWMRSVVRTEGLVPCSISKYCMSLESWMTSFSAFCDPDPERSEG